MKLLKNLFFPLVLLAMMFTSCDRDNTIDDNEVIIDDTNIEIEANPLVSRSSGGNGEGMDFDCFVIKYTFAFVDVDGNEYPVSSDDELIELFDSGEELAIVDFAYPFTASTDAGDTQVNNVEELEALFAGCTPSGGWEEGDFPAFAVNYDNSCYELVYPVSVKDIDGNETEIADEDAFNDAVAEDYVFFVFPLSLLEEDGSTVVVEDIDDLFDALISCNGFGVDTTFVGVEWEWESGFEYFGCYMLQFPFDVTLVDGSVVTVTNHEEYCDLMLTGELVDFAYPLTLVGDDGAEHAVNSEDELEALMLECDDIWSPTLDGGLFILYFGADPIDGEACYEINYPFEVTDGSENVSVANLSELEELTWSEFQNLVYPVDVVLASDGSTYTIDGIEALFGLLEICE